MPERKGSTNALVAAAIVLIALFLAFFLWRTFAYYRAIRSGESIVLPQFSSSLSPDPGADERRRAVAAGRAELETGDDPALGAPLEDAELVIVEFIDYECPFCKSVSGTVRTMASRYGDRARFIIRDFPVLELHPNALLAAEALGCAEEQGAFWPMHDRAFAENGDLTRAVLDRLAERSGLDRAEYEACMADHRRVAEIEADVEAARAAGVVGTPTFFFNGVRVEGAIPEPMFEEIIKGFLRL